MPVRFIVVSILIFSCFNAAPPQIRQPKFEDFKREMMPQLGQKIAIVGILQTGKLGWWVPFKNWGVYIHATNGSDFAKMSNLTSFAGKTVEVRGTLRYFASTESATTALPVAAPPEHFYFDIAEVTVVGAPRITTRIIEALAERAWPPFFTSLRTAVRKRDRITLRALMIPEFRYTLGHHATDNRDAAFEYWDQPYVRGWRALERALAQGTVKAALWWGSDSNTPSRIAPPAANVRRNILHDRVPWYAEFQFREDGKWHWVTFIECCD